MEIIKIIELNEEEKTLLSKATMLLFNIAKTAEQELGHHCPIHSTAMAGYDVLETLTGEYLDFDFRDYAE